MPCYQDAQTAQEVVCWCSLHTYTPEVLTPGQKPQILSTVMPSVPSAEQSHKNVRRRLDPIAQS